jgi:hypothetical protein
MIGAFASFLMMMDMAIVGTDSLPGFTTSDHPSYGLSQKPIKERWVQFGRKPKRFQRVHDLDVAEIVVKLKSPRHTPFQRLRHYCRINNLQAQKSTT